MNQEAWDAITSAMHTLRTVFARETVPVEFSKAARAAWFDLFCARAALIDAAEKASGLGLTSVKED